MLIDTHAHVNFDAYQEDQEKTLLRAFEAGIEAVMCIGMLPEGGRSALELSRSYPGKVFCSVGVHPYDAEHYTPELGQELRTLLQEPEMLLCGEMGIDTFKCQVDLEVQKYAFAEQLKLAQELDKPVCIHCRDAFPIVQSVFQEVGIPERKGFAHCFSDGPEEALAWKSMGFKISFAGQVTFKNAEKLREAVKVLEPEDCVVETDCPFLAPTPHRGKRNEPSYVRYTVDKLAEIWERSSEEIASITSQNAREVLRLS